MANETRTHADELGALLPSIVAEAMFQAQERSVMRNLVRNYNMSVGSGKTITVPIWDNTSAAGLTEGTDMANTALSTTSAVLTVSEVGVMATITDLALKTSAANVISDAGRVMGAAVAKKMDQDLIGLFDAFTTNALGGATTAMTAAEIFKAISMLRNQGVSGDDIACVVHPFIAFDLKSALTSSYVGNAGDLSNEALRSGYVGTVGGVNIFESSHITNASGVSKGAVFHKDALGLAMLDDISIETQRDASLRGTELVCTANYGVGELVDKYGVEMHYQSSDSALQAL
jgi:N4-gp56 family major capsid protein